MKRVTQIFLVILVLLLLCAPAQASWCGVKKKCPVCGTTDYYYAIYAISGNLFESYSRFYYVFWPMIDEYCLYSCQKCHFTTLMWDFESVPKDKIAAVKNALKSTELSPPDKKRVLENQDALVNATYCYIPMNERILIAEKVYTAIGQTDEQWCLFYRVAAFHYQVVERDKEAHDAWQKALDYARKLIADKKNVKKLKELYVISGAMRHFLNDDKGARSDFKKARAAHFEDLSLNAQTAKEFEENIDSLIQEFLTYKGDQIDIILAATQGKPARVTALLDKNPKLIKTKEKSGATLLHIAEQAEEYSTELPWERKIKLIKLLIARGADVNARGENGDTPLHIAAVYGNLDAVKLLISAGANVNAKNSNSETPLAVGEVEDVKAYLRAHGGR